MTISIISALAHNNAIGQKNDLLVYLSADLKRFKQLTTGHPIIMGRKTFESLPNGALPNRENIVITQQPNYKADGCTIVNSVEEAVKVCQSTEEAFVIGGASIYKAFMPYANKLYITHINKTFKDADTFFPNIDTDTWKEEKTSDTLIDEKTKIEYSYTNYVKI